MTDYIRYGEENTLAVKVYRWCDGSWLEDQDYFDLSGIFRDVYLYATPQTFVRDYSLVTDFDADFTDSTFSVTLMLENRSDADGEISVSAQLTMRTGSRSHGRWMQRTRYFPQAKRRASP